MDKDVVLPPDIAALLPGSAEVERIRVSPAVTIPAGHRLCRAAWNHASVLPSVAQHSYRFGPPPAVVAANSGFPYWWLYVARRAMTCVYEAAFCGHDARLPGTFFIEPVAQAQGLMVSLRFPAPLRLLDLTGDAAFQLNLHDRLSSPD